MLAHVSFVLSQITRLTDGRTDVDFLVANPRWHSVQRGKNVRKKVQQSICSVFIVYKLYRV